MTKYQEALIKLVNHNYSTRSEKNEHIKTLQELVDKETPMTPTYKNTYIEYKEHYLDKDYRMLYHCPKCDCVVYPLDRCRHCNQKLDWNEYFEIDSEGRFRDKHT